MQKSEKSKGSNRDGAFDRGYFSVALAHIAISMSQGYSGARRVLLKE